MIDQNFALEILGALEGMVRQNCDEPEQDVFSTGFQRYHKEAFNVLVRAGVAQWVNPTRHSDMSHRGGEIKFLGKVEEG